ncbi:MAG: nucleotidyltransferase family protein, partial [Planctomycetota bacterium]
MKVILLAAGYATRLYPLTKNQPKPLLKVGEKTICDHILDKVMVLKDVDQIYVITNDKFYSHFCEWREEKEEKGRIQILNDGTKNENDRLGAIGDI